MSNIITKSCDDSELQSIEESLRAQGFRLTSKSNEKELMPFEYMKTSYHGSEESFHGPRRWTVIARSQ